MLLIPPHFLAGTIEPIAGLKPYSRARGRGARPLHPRGLQRLSQPAGAPVQERDGSLRRATRSPERASTTGRSCGARAGPGPIWRGSAASTPRRGTGCTSATRATSSRARTCPRSSSSRSASSTCPTSRASSRCCAGSGIPTGRRDRGRRGRRARAGRAGRGRAARGRDHARRGAGAQRGDRADRLPADAGRGAPRGARADGPAGRRGGEAVSDSKLEIPELPLRGSGVERDGIGEDDHPIPLWFNAAWIASWIAGALYIAWYLGFSDWSSHGAVGGGGRARRPSRRRRSRRRARTRTRGNAAAIAEGAETFADDLHGVSRPRRARSGRSVARRPVLEVRQRPTPTTSRR